MSNLKVIHLLTKDRLNIVCGPLSHMIECVVILLKKDVSISAQGVQL